MTVERLSWRFGLSHLGARRLRIANAHFVRCAAALAIVFLTASPASADTSSDSLASITGTGSTNTMRGITGTGSTNIEAATTLAQNLWIVFITGPLLTLTVLIQSGLSMVLWKDLKRVKAAENAPASA